MRFRVLVVTQRKRVAEVELAVLAEPQLRVGDGGEKELMDYCFISEGRRGEEDFEEDSKWPW